MGDEVDENPFAIDSETEKNEGIVSSRPVPITDPLVRMATRESNSPPTKNIPLLGEIPVDGSLVVLAPAAVIAVVGLIMSFVVAFQARDDILETLSSVNPPPPRPVVTSDKCRGICSDQEQSLNELREFMGSFSKRSDK